MLEIIISKRSSELLSKGFPWVYTRDVVTKSSGLDLADKGELCHILDEKGRKIAVGYFNNNTNIAIRVLSMNAKENIDVDFFYRRFSGALKKRRKSLTDNYMRLVYGESDWLPGLIIDMYGEYAVAQVNSAGMQLLQKYWLPALVSLMEVKGIYLDASSKHRKTEGLNNVSQVIFGHIPEQIEVKENNISYFADLFYGQKTGWFYDQRANRRFFAGLTGNLSVLDLYTHTGGFGLLAARYGAQKVVMVDRSELALGLARKSYEKMCNAEWREIARLDPTYSFKVSGNVTRDGVDVPELEFVTAGDADFIKAEVFDYLESIEGTKFDVVNADPPAFIKHKDDLAVGLKGYEKLTRKCIAHVKKRGVFSISSCSYFARPEVFQKTIERGIAKTGRSFELMYKAGASADHPIHPMLAETNYLKFLVFRLDL